MVGIGRWLFGARALRRWARDRGHRARAPWPWRHLLIDGAIDGTRFRARLGELQLMTGDRLPATLLRVERRGEACGALSTPPTNQGAGWRFTASPLQPKRTRAELGVGAEAEKALTALHDSLEGRADRPVAMEVRFGPDAVEMTAWYAVDEPGLLEQLLHWLTTQSR